MQLVAGDVDDRVELAAAQSFMVAVAVTAEALGAGEEPDASPTSAKQGEIVPSGGEEMLGDGPADKAGAAEEKHFHGHSSLA